jgi:hypothetical protein
MAGILLNKRRLKEDESNVEQAAVVKKPQDCWNIKYGNSVIE